MRIARSVASFAAAATLLATLLSCSKGSTADGSDRVDSVVVIRIESGTDMRGLTMTLSHATDMEVRDVVPDDSPLDTASCQANVTTGHVVAACASTTSFSAPIDAWRVIINHQTSRTALSGINDLECEASNAAGDTFFVTCMADEP